uniref:Secreted protein n=1 Tax=Romanomermis culicivorax TaxID=13658 RepID=A0A915IQS6_ROMCU
MVWVTVVIVPVVGTVGGCDVTVGGIEVAVDVASSTSIGGGGSGALNTVEVACEDLWASSRAFCLSRCSWRGVVRLLGVLPCSARKVLGGGVRLVWVAAYALC